VRIVSAAQLVREGGERELRIADAELVTGTQARHTPARQITGSNH